jgi:hypothetical protein
MSNRMSVLSRRLKRFAAGFSFATVAFFLIGLFAAAKTEGQVVFVFAGLVSLCFFATLFLWLAHGFAWAMIPEEPAEAKKPAETMKPAEVMKAAEAKRPAEVMKAAEAKRRAEPMKAVEEKRHAEPMKAVEEKKPAEEKVTSPADPPDAKYTITGRRIY